MWGGRPEGQCFAHGLTYDRSMGDLFLQRTERSRPLGVVVLLHLLAAGCAGDSMPKGRESPVLLRVEEDWELLVEQPTDGFADTVGRNAADFADGGGKGTAIVGCVAGGMALAAVSQGHGGQAGCVLGGLALYPVGYVLGFGTGAIVGTVQGAINRLADAGEEIDTRALLAVFENATPRIDLTDAMLAQSQRLSPVTLVRSAGPGETGNGAPPAEPDRQLTLTITRFRLTTTTSVRPTSRLHLAVKGELTDSETGQRIRAANWSYVSEALSTAQLADDGAKAMQSELAVGWGKLANEIIADLFGSERR